MKKSVYDWLNLVIGILLVITGFYLFFVPGFENLALAGYLIAFLFLFKGINLIYGYTLLPKAANGGWLLALGIISVLFGLWALIGWGFLAISAVLPYILALFILTYGIIIFSASIKFKHVGHWVLYLVLGILFIVEGIVLFFNPVYSAEVIAILVPLYFIFTGFSSINLFANPLAGTIAENL